MKKSLLAMTALAAMLFAGCTSSDEITTLETIKQAENAPTPVSFGTYMGRTGTRAGAVGSITSDGANGTNKLGTAGYEFGVFAYYTGKHTYGQQQGDTYTGETSRQTNIVPNFMYNQKVYLDGSSWKYTPLKYWPNDYASDADVDDQNALGSSNYGGNVSFFAYAPYVTDTDISANSSDGITAKSANNNTGDPIITYKLDSHVDLLWGTKGASTGTNTLGSGNTGVAGSGTQGTASTTYAGAIINGNSTNADLNKQKVDGQVDFLFKHALAAIGGGSAAGPGVGFRVQLDIDNSLDGEIPAPSSETGGSIQAFETDYWRTKVTIKDITITNDFNNDGDASDPASTPAPAELALYRTGQLNLATGQWTGSDGGVVKQKVLLAASYDKENVKLNTKISEIKDATGYVTPNFNDYTATVKDYFAKSLDSSLPGVKTTPVDVYNDNTQSPLMLIPGQAPLFKITVEYVVRQYDEALATKYTEINNKITKYVQFPTIEINKYYSLLMHLGLTSVKFTASVSTWASATVIDSDGDGNADNDVYLPINVQ